MRIPVNAVSRYLPILLACCALVAQTRPNRHPQPAMHAADSAGPMGSAGWLNVRDFGAMGDGYTDDAAAIQSAINQAVGAGGGVVFFPPGTFLIGSGLKITGSNIALQGSGKTATTIFGGIPVDWSISALTTTMKSNIEIRDLTMDTNNAGRASAVQAGYVNGFAVRRCRFQNVATSGWGLFIGVPDRGDSDSTAIHNFNIVVEDSDFDTLAGTLEQALVFNAANVHFARDTFANAPDGNGIGLYQNIDNVTVEDSTFDNLSNGIYYSQTTNNLVFRNRPPPHP
jgi:Pectate lyase superfamily protein